MRKIFTPQYPICISSFAAVGGYEERRGPLGDLFDLASDDDRFGEKTWERAEGEMGRVCLNLAMKKADISPTEIDLLLAGDLQNQCVATSGGLLTFGIPFIGLYGACSTLTEGLCTAAAYLSADSTLSRCAVVTSSHNCAAERQFRTPLEYGAQRAPSAQWTATAAGAFILGRYGRAGIRGFLPGVMTDGYVRDGANMGAAMAPAALDTILRYFSLSGKRPSDFDLIVTGDLGAVGSEILREMLGERLPGAERLHTDCGLLLYDRDRRDFHSGGSGCGCSASVLAAKLLPQICRGELHDVLFLSTGALMSPSSVQQGQNITGIAHAVHISAV